jgi:hypothetical protein
LESALTHRNSAGMLPIPSDSGARSGPSFDDRSDFSLELCIA